MAMVAHQDNTLKDEGSIPCRVTKRYNRVGQLMIRPLVMRGEHSAFDLARLFYAQYANLNFEDDIIDYMRNGFVTVRPHIFGMFKAIIHEGRRGWFVRIAVGDLMELVACLPTPLAFIAFCRNNNSQKMVVVDSARLIELARQTAAKQEAE